MRETWWVVTSACGLWNRPLFTFRRYWLIEWYKIGQYTNSTVLCKHRSFLKSQIASTFSLQNWRKSLNVYTNHGKSSDKSWRFDEFLREDRNTLMQSEKKCNSDFLVKCKIVDLTVQGFVRASMKDESCKVCQVS